MTSLLASPDDFGIPHRNAHGYVDPTACKALKQVQRAEFGYRPLVYICSPYAGDIDTNTADGEVLLTLLASFAQAESESISANTRWGIRSKYPQGKPHSRHPYGYRYDHGMLHIIDTETAIIARLFDEFLAGISPEATVKALNAEGLHSRSDGLFRASITRSWLENLTYIGTLICQDYYRPHIANPTGTRNTGLLPKYIITDHHQPIIDRTIFDAVQTELARRRASGGRALTPSVGTNAFTHRIRCTICGRNYQRRTKTRTTGTHTHITTGTAITTWWPIWTSTAAIAILVTLAGWLFTRREL